MTPVQLTKFLSRGERGNCLAACLASLFEMDLKDVPAFEEMPQQEWVKAFVDWVAEQGFKVRQADLGSFEPDTYGIIVGLSANGNRHACVGLNGVVVHDPDPDEEGVAKALLCYVFTPIRGQHQRISLVAPHASVQAALEKQAGRAVEEISVNTP